MYLSRRHRALINALDHVRNYFPKKSDEQQMEMAILNFNKANPQEPATVSELMEALEAKVN